MIKVTCMNCNKIFLTHNCQIKSGGGKFCSLSCTRTYKNLHDNPSKKQDVKDKISKNHADVSGQNNPMYGRKGKEHPNYKDGRSKFNGRVGRRVCLTNKLMVCEICGEKNIKKLEAHHKDKNRKNNELKNLSVLCKYCHNNIIHKYVKSEKTGRIIGQITDNTILNIKREG